MQQSLNSYGEIVKLIQKYQISRSFVYLLLDRFKSHMSQVFSPKEQEKEVSKKEIISRMLLQRMVGKSSIEAISTIMRYDALEYSSVGSISQSLSEIGGLLTPVQSLVLDKKVEITAVSDEIFIANQPILITVEPKSSAILAIELTEDRKKITWSKHLDKIESGGKVNIISMVSE